MPALDPTQLKAIVFDVDGTLYAQKPVQRGMALRLVRSHLLRPFAARTAMRALVAYRRAQETLRAEDLAAGGGLGDLGARQIAHASKASGVSQARVQELVRRWMEQEPLSLVAQHKRPGLDAFLDAARARGIALGVFSDYPAQAKLEALGIADRIDVQMCAQDEAIGRFKPDPRGILAVLERLGVPASEAPTSALYVGDRPEVDGAAADAAPCPCAIIGAKDPTAASPHHLVVSTYDELRAQTVS